MKRLILSLVVILISTNTLHAANFKWTKIETTDDGGMTIYVDKKTVFRVGSYKYFWLLSDYLNPSEDPEKSVITYMMVNCSTYESRPITFTGFSENMGKGEIEMDITYLMSNITCSQTTTIANTPIYPISSFSLIRYSNPRK